MPTFFFDIFDGRSTMRDAVGADLESAEEAFLEAASLLPDFARDVVLDRQSHDFAASVRDVSGRVLYRAVLLFRSQSTQPAIHGDMVCVAGDRYEVARAVALRKQAADLADRLSENIQDLFSTIENVKLNVDRSRESRRKDV